MAVSVGKEVKSYCGSCKLSLWHVVVAMNPDGSVARVKCNTCKGMHNFKDPSAGVIKKISKTTTGVKKTPVSSQSAKDLWDQQAKVNTKKSKAYSIQSKFDKGDVIEHAKFGIGFVQSVSNDKFEVLFQDDLKTLVHNRT